MEGDVSAPDIPTWNTHFNPLPPHGGRHAGTGLNAVCFFISIHSLRMEGDDLPVRRFRRCCTFQSTPSAWRETIDLPGQITWLIEFQSTPSAWRETL